MEWVGCEDDILGRNPDIQVNIKFSVIVTVFVGKIVRNILTCLICKLFHMKACLISIQKCEQQRYTSAEQSWDLIIFKIKTHEFVLKCFHFSYQVQSVWGFKS